VSTAARTSSDLEYVFIQPTPGTAAHLVAEAKQHIENLTPEQLEAELSSNHVVLVDLREPDDRAQNGTIRGAVHTPSGMPRVAVASVVPSFDTPATESRPAVVGCTYVRLAATRRAADPRPDVTPTRLESP
jgi:rhodanese-related sulfurtransferase